jgi:carboxylesterase
MNSSGARAMAESNLGRYALFERRGDVGILLIHGITGAPTEMKPVARRLAARGFTVACPPLAGHCSSLRDLRRTRWTDWYRSVADGFDFLRTQCETVFVSGLSMGALLALKLAADRPDQVQGVATMSATFFYDGWNVPRLKQRFLLPMVLHTPLRYFLSYREPAPYGIKDERLRNIVAMVYAGNHNNLPQQYGYSEFPAVTVLESFRLIRHVKRCLPNVVAPALILHAMEDDMASVENARFLARRIRSRRIECCYFDDTYHVLTMDRRRNDVAERVGQFVTRVAADAASCADRTETIEVSRMESTI